MVEPRRVLNCRIVSRRLREPFRIADRVYDAFDTIVVEVSAGSWTGRGEGAPLSYLGQTPNDLVDWVEAARDLVESGCGMPALREAMPASGARNAIDCALWDLAAQQTGEPVWRLAGLAEPQPLRTTFTIGCGSPGEMARSALRWDEAQALKLKLGGDGHDAERIAAVRAARPDVWLAVDANRSLTPDSFAAIRPALEVAAIALVEQPLAVGQEASVATLDAPVPVFADESFQTLADFPIVMGRFDGINIKLDKCGGLTEALLILREARRLGLSVMVGNMGGSSLAMAPAWIIASACDHVDLDGPIYLETDETPAADYRGGLVACDQRLWGTRRIEGPRP